MEQKILSLKDDKINSEVELVEYPVELRGGRNLIRNSGQFKNLEYWFGYTSCSLNLIDEYIRVETTSSGTPRVANGTLFPLMTEPQTNTIVVEYISDSDITQINGKLSNSLTVLNESGGQTAGTFTRIKREVIDGNRKKDTFRWVTLTKTETRLSSWIYIYFPQNSIADIVNISVVNSLKPLSDWSPAPEDLGLSYSDFITEFKPSISDRYILTEELIENQPTSFSNNILTNEFIENGTIISE